MTGKNSAQSACLAVLHLSYYEGPCEVDLDVARKLRNWLVHKWPMEGHAGIVDQTEERVAAKQLPHLPAHDWNGEMILCLIQGSNMPLGHAENISYDHFRRHRCS